MKDYKKIILGIDPGTNVLGFGIIGIINEKMHVVTSGVIKMNKLDNHELKLKCIFENISSLIDQYLPDEVAIESPFFGKNVQSMLKLGRAQGVAMAAVLVKDLPIKEYSPRKIKKSITGNGNSSKEQVASMLKTVLNLKEIPKSLDATDGLAIAVCHYFQNNINDENEKYSGWKGFINQNPNRTN